MTCFYTFCAPNREAWAGAVLVFPNPGKPVRDTVLLHSVLTFIFLNWFPFLLPSYCLQQGFLPSEIPMPSPNAISPSGLKSSSQFYSYEGSNPRRRSPQEPIGKILKDRFFGLGWWAPLQIYTSRFKSLFTIASAAAFLQGNFTSPWLMRLKSRHEVLCEKSRWITSTTQIPFDYTLMSSHKTDG